MNRKELQSKIRRMLVHSEHVADDARQILMHVTNLSHAELVAHDNELVSRSEQSRALKLAKARSAGKPMAYILNKRDFFGRAFLVNKHVLIPRPETEVMVEEALELANKKTMFVDIGTGSGAIAITLALESKLPVMATEISKGALKMAKQNATELEATVDFHHGSLLEPIWRNELAGHGKIVITANLPYLSESMLSSSPVEVRDYEPKIALVSDDSDGLDLYRELLAQIQARRNEFPSELVLLIEIDPRQSKIVKNMINEIEPSANVEIKNDLAGKPRVVITNLSS